MILFTITRRGEGTKIIKMLEGYHVPWHFRLVGQGTASSEMMDILGLDSRDKDIILSICTQNVAEHLAWEIDSDPTRGRGHGIMMIIPIDAIGNITAKLISRLTGEVPKQEEKMKNEYKHTLLLIAVNRGWAEEVMKTARGAGATGGTVLRANLADNNADALLGFELGDEREIVATLVPDTIRNRVMEDVNKEFGLRTQAQAIICAVGVDKAIRI